MLTTDFHRLPSYFVKFLIFLPKIHVFLALHPHCQNYQGYKGFEILLYLQANRFNMAQPQSCW